jgi:aspartyl aminopeptidase
LPKLSCAPVLRIPTLAIHLDPQETFSFNKETQLFPIAGMVAAELNRKKPDEASSDADAPPKTTEVLKGMTDRHHPYLVETVAKAARVAPNDILDFELLLYDTQAACIGGLNDELIFSARLDNLMMSFCGLMGLIYSIESPSSLKEDNTIRLLSLFDHEEIGSQTAQGADSNLLPTVLRRLSLLSYSEHESPPGSAYEQCLARSFLVSADMAHSVHPNYPTKYEADHRPEINKGVVIKINANARYATNSPGIVLMQEVAREAKDEDGEPDGVPLQLFVVRNDSRCGSTIGPMLAAALGTRTLDLGNPQLSMHSIRETGGVDDVRHAIRLMRSFYENYSTIANKITVD